MEKHEKPRQKPSSTPSSEHVMGQPEDVWDMVNKYGHYEVQDTTQSGNVFPLIGPLGAGMTGVVLPDIPDAVSEADEEEKKRS